MVPERGAWRLLRAATLAGCVLALAATAHLAAGGALPGPFVLGGLAVVLTCVAHVLAGRRLTPLRSSTAFGAGQVLLHEVFDAASSAGPAGHGSGGLLVHHGGHVVGRLPDVAAAAPPAWSAAMTGAHVAATLACALLLAHGDHVLGLLLAWLAPLRAGVPAVRGVVPVPRVPVPHPVVAPRALPVPARQVSRRGPPGVPAPATA